jgi:uncharacterized damage-inducible protein DinB
MADVRELAADNATLLQHAIELIARLEDRLFRGDPAGDGRDGVGKQFRHVIDFYRCCLEGLAGGKVDYARRDRDPRVEHERAAAREALEAVRGRLVDLSDDAELHVAVDRLAGSEETAWSRSSLLRELHFLMSHTVHHFALIRWILKLQGVDVEPGFGVAPSTLRYWGESAVGAASPTD